MSGANISNVIVVSGTVDGSIHIGGIVGYAKEQSKINHCINFAKIECTQVGGGIVGTSTSSDVTFCANYATISGKQMCGGIVGNQLLGKISNCLASCSLSGTSIIAGIAGKTTGRISSCAFIGDITGKSTSKRGMICCGKSSFSVADCFAIVTGSNLVFAGTAENISDSLYIYAGDKYYYNTNNFKNWVIAPGTPLGFLPKGFSWFAEGGAPVTLKEIVAAQFVPAPTK